jgi:hypothetical protein
MAALLGPHRQKGEARHLQFVIAATVMMMMKKWRLIHHSRGFNEMTLI